MGWLQPLVEADGDFPCRLAAMYPGAPSALIWGRTGSFEMTVPSSWLNQPPPGLGLRHLRLPSPTAGSDAGGPWTSATLARSEVPPLCFGGGPHEGGAGPAAAVLCFLPHDAAAEAGAHATAPSLPSHRKKRLGQPVTTGAAFEPKRLAPNTRLPGASGRGRLCLLRGLVPTCAGAASQALPRRRCLGAWSPGCGGHPASFRARVPRWGRPPGHSRVLERGPHARPAGDADGTWPSPPALIGDGCRQGFPLARRATHKLPTPPA